MLMCPGCDNRACRLHSCQGGPIKQPEPAGTIKYLMWPLEKITAAEALKRWPKL